VRVLKIILPCLILVAGTIFFYPNQKALSSDDFNLTYSLTEGGFRLELNDMSFKGVEVTVSSDVDVRYEVTQRVVSPMQNRDNPSVILRDNFVFRGLRGTNSYGDLRVTVTDAPVRSNEVLYVSDTAGTADSFTLAYGVRNVADIEPGLYTGKIAFILNPISSNRQQVTQILDVYINVSRDDVGVGIEISTATGSKRILLDPSKQQNQSQDVSVKVSGTFRRPFRIIQLLNQALESSDGKKLDEDAVNFVVREAKVGSGVDRSTPLKRGMQEVYASSAGGQADRAFVISYSLGEALDVKSGRYRGRLEYLLEQMGKQTRIDTLEVEVESEPVFDLVITPVGQQYAIEFRNVRASEPPRTSEVDIEVLNNTGRKYQVTQEVYSDLSSAGGQTISSQYFTMQTESLDTKGNLKITLSEEVKKGSNVLFLSDNFGSPDKFRVGYQLACPEDLIAGDYSTRITYSLSEI